MSRYETIPYTVIETHDNIEIRQYANFLLASTKTNKNKYNDSGFNNVFGYISGQNDKEEKISMTTPVVTYEEEESLVTGFYVPSKYDESSVPKPRSNRVFIEDYETSLFGVVRFKGRWTESNYKPYDKQLRQFLTDHGYDIKSSRYVFRYQPPFIPGFLRKNEIAYQITKAPK